MSSRSIFMKYYNNGNVDLAGYRRGLAAAHLAPTKLRIDDPKYIEKRLNKYFETNYDTNTGVFNMVHDEVVFRNFRKCLEKIRTTEYKKLTTLTISISMTDEQKKDFIQFFREYTFGHLKTINIIGVSDISDFTTIKNVEIKKL